MLQPITVELIDSLLEKARGNPRKRVIHTLHHGAWEHAHRMINAITTDSYSQPHKHLDPHKSEAFVILQGKAAVAVFDDAGNLDPQQTAVLEAGSSIMGVDIAPGTWHNVVALQDSVLFEVKGQPDEGYVQEEDKIFAEWSPAEGSEGVDEYLRRLREAIASVI